jgi:predicted  nucleic acid-binding Zn-ribbon protein
MSDEMNTKPTIETLLARVNEWGMNITNELAEIKTGQAELRKGQAELRQEVDELRKGQGELRKALEEFRADMNEALYRVKRQIQTMNDNHLEMMGDFRQLAILFEKLEAEVSPAK